MTNHVHLLAVPRAKGAMAGGVERSHMRYSHWMNKERGWTGHSWANRFHSSMLDGEHLWNAVRYVEQNPVRAGLVARCEDWAWSSTRAHAGLLGDTVDPLLSTTSPFPGGVPDWQAWVNAPLDAAFYDRLRINTSTGRPTASNEVIKRVEQLLKRELSAPRKRGRPSKQLDAAGDTDDLFQ